MYFSFNVGNNSPDIQLSSPSLPHGSAHLLHGVSVFRQEYDASTKRNFNQKCLVLLSSHDCPAFFMTLLRVITRDSTIGDVTRLESACAQICLWKAPHIGKQQLPFLGEIINLDIPLYASFPLSGRPAPSSATTSLIHSLSATDPTESWQSLFEHLPSAQVLYVLYECLLLGESVIVLGHSPRQVSAICTALLDLIRPIPFAGKIRPYLPMQSIGSGTDTNLLDPESKQSFIAGITNPFLLQRYSNPSTTSIPYILALNAHRSPPHQRSPSPARNGSRLPSLKPSRSIHRRSSVPSHSSTMKRIDIPGTPIKSQSRPEHFIKIDKSFLNGLSDSDEQESQMALLNIPRHFTDLTARLLAPIQRFMATRAGAGPTSDKQSYAPSGTLMNDISHTNFSVLSFLDYLQKEETSPLFVGQTGHGRQKSREAFYTRFCISDNFKQWLEVSRFVEQQSIAGVFV